MEGEHASWKRLMSEWKCRTRKTESAHYFPRALSARPYQATLCFFGTVSVFFFFSSFPFLSFFFSFSVSPPVVRTTGASVFAGSQEIPLGSPLSRRWRREGETEPREVEGRRRKAGGPISILVSLSGSSVIVLFSAVSRCAPDR